MSRQKILISVVLILAILQFVVVPSFEYIDEQQETVIAQKNKSNKQDSLLRLAEPIQQQTAEVNSILENLARYTFATSSIEAGTLEVQKKFEDAAKKYNVKINRLNWLEPDDREVDQNTIQLVIVATPADWLLFQNELESADWATLVKMTFFYQRQSRTQKLIGEISGVLAFSINFMVEASDNDQH